MNPTTSTSSLKCVVVTPEKAVLDVKAEFIVLPLYDGEFGVLPGHAPLVGRLGPGELRVKQGEKTLAYFVDGGFAQVRANVVTVLTPRAIEAKDVAPIPSQQMLADALAMPADTPRQRELRDAAIASARARIRISEKYT